MCRCQSARPGAAAGTGADPQPRLCAGGDGAAGGACRADGRRAPPQAQDAAGRNGGTKTDPAAEAARCGVALRASPRRRWQIDLLPLGSFAEHRCRGFRAPRPGAGGIRRDGVDESARPAAVAGTAARLPRGHRRRPRPSHLSPTRAEDALTMWADQSLADRLTGDNLLAHLRAGTAFMLLDGLDEVPVSDTRDGATIYPRDLLLTG